VKAYGIGDQSGRGGLHRQDLPDREPAPGEVLVRVTAAGLNYRDLMLLRGAYGAPQPASRVPLADGVGVVAALGEGVTGLAVGDRVIAPHFVNWLDGPYSMAVFGRDLGATADGWLAEQILLPAAAAIRVPAAMDDATAATFAVGGATVWHAMVHFGAVKPGDLVLAQGTGGMAIFALLLAKALGADFAITSSSDAKLDQCRALGADFTVNYCTHADWPAALLVATAGRGANVVVDTLGFSALGQTVAATAVEGRIGTLGALSGSPQDAATASQGLMIAKNIAIKGIASGSRAMLVAAMEVFAAKSLAMPIDREFAFDDAPAAFAHLESGQHLGKILVRVG
jgi:NADPH:quinone reductase-like Zn-dependent oxidoreductase